jgi:hypothetical protein
LDLPQTLAAFAEMPWNDSDLFLVGRRIAEAAAEAGQSDLAVLAFEFVVEQLEGLDRPDEAAEVRQRLQELVPA